MPNPATAWSVRADPNEREKKETQVRRVKKGKVINGQRAKSPTPAQALDALIGDEEQNGKEKKETWNGSPTLDCPILSPSTTNRDHTVSLFF